MITRRNVLFGFLAAPIVVRGGFLMPVSNRPQMLTATEVMARQQEWLVAFCRRGFGTEECLTTLFADSMQSAIAKATTGFEYFDVWAVAKVPESIKVAPGAVNAINMVRL